MNILAFETSCDETSVAVIKDGTQVLSCEIASSMNIHTETGGIIPENAARKQIEYMIPTLESALKTAFPNGKEYEENIRNEIDSLAVTIGPGLIGSLLVGIETAKTLATLFDKPLIPVNHVVAHMYAPFLDSEVLPAFPFLSLIVSGGHTDLVLVKGHGDFTRIGGTRDDAAGEAFDKCARIIGLGYPGGPLISKNAQVWREKNPDSRQTMLPRPMIHEPNLEMSFSGLKTAVLKVSKENIQSQQYTTEQLSAEIEEAIVDTLVHKTVKAIEEFEVKDVVLCGGVSANPRLRFKLKSIHLIEQAKLKLHVPQFVYCTDNAAMIGCCAYFNPHSTAINAIDAKPELHF